MPKVDVIPWVQPDAGGFVVAGSILRGHHGNPGYPQMGQGQGQMGQMGQMGHMGHMGPPMGGMPPPMRRGTSKAVPVVVSAGLAVGVFCGLLFGLGTEQSEASNEPAKGNNVKADTGSDSTAAPEGLGATAALPAPGSGAGSAVGSGSATTNPAVAAGSGAGSAAAGSGAGSGAGSAVPTITSIKLTIENRARGGRVLGEDRRRRQGD